MCYLTQAFLPVIGPRGKGRGVYHDAIPSTDEAAAKHTRKYSTIFPHCTQQPEPVRVEFCARLTTEHDPEEDLRSKGDGAPRRPRARVAVQSERLAEGGWRESKAAINLVANKQHLPRR